MHVDDITRILRSTHFNSIGKQESTDDETLNLYESILSTRMQTSADLFELDETRRLQLVSEEQSIKIETDVMQLQHCKYIIVCLFETSQLQSTETILL